MVRAQRLPWLCVQTTRLVPAGVEESVSSFLTPVTPKLMLRRVVWLPFIFLHFFGVFIVWFLMGDGRLA
jgi:hypothetical protein